jgi:hypothetical protein
MERESFAEIGVVRNAAGQGLGPNACRRGNSFVACRFAGGGERNLAFAQPETENAPSGYNRKCDKADAGEVQAQRVQTGGEAIVTTEAES